MNANEIKKALEGMVKFADMVDRSVLDAVDVQLLKAILDLINRLQADSKRLKKVQMQLDDAMKMYHIIKAEAIKEFAERLKETKFKHGNDYIIYADNLDNLLKEMGVE